MFGDCSSEKAAPAAGRATCGLGYLCTCVFGLCFFCRRDVLDLSVEIQFPGVTLASLLSCVSAKFHLQAPPRRERKRRLVFISQRFHHARRSSCAPCAPDPALTLGEGSPAGAIGCVRRQKHQPEASACKLLKAGKTEKTVPFSLGFGHDGSSEGCSQS